MTDHDLFKTGDEDAPEIIKDSNGEVELGLCRRCGRGEAELEEPCVPRTFAFVKDDNGEEVQFIYQSLSETPPLYFLVMFLHNLVRANTQITMGSLAHTLVFILAGMMPHDNVPGTFDEEAYKDIEKQLRHWRKHMLEAYQQKKPFLLDDFGLVADIVNVPLGPMNVVLGPADQINEDTVPEEDRDDPDLEVTHEPFELFGLANLTSPKGSKPN